MESEKRVFERRERMRTLVETFTITDGQLALDIMHGLRERNPKYELDIVENRNPENGWIQSVTIHVYRRDN